MPIEIRVDGVSELVRRIETIEQFKRVRAAVHMAGRHMQGVMRDYPTNRHGPNPLIRSNANVRRWFFYHLKKGNISVPYKRTHDLKRMWTVKMVDNALTAHVGNNTKYWPLVQSAANQTFGHARSGWITEEQAVRQESDTVIAYIRDALVREVGGF